MTLSIIVQNTTDPMNLLCTVNQANNGWMILTMLSIIGFAAFIGTYIWKRDLFVSAASCFTVLGFIGLLFRLISCGNGYYLVNSQTVIVFFIAAAIFTALVRITRRNES